MRRFLTPRMLLALLPLLTGGCDTPGRRLARLETAYREELAPLLALAQSREGLPIVSGHYLNEALRLTGQLLDGLDRIDPLPSGKQARTRYARLQQDLRRERERLLTLRHDPSVYNLGGDLLSIDQAGDSSGTERSRRLREALERAPAYYDSAKVALQAPDPRRLELALRKQQETLTLLSSDLLDTLPGAAAGRQRARYAVKDYLAFCRSLLFEQQDTQFRK